MLNDYDAWWVTKTGCWVILRPGQAPCQPPHNTPDLAASASKQRDHQPLNIRLNYSCPVHRRLLLWLHVAVNLGL
jgi:hypothetical protein